MSKIICPFGGRNILGVYTVQYISDITLPKIPLGALKYWTIFFVYSPDYIFRNNAI